MSLQLRWLRVLSLLVLSLAPILPASLLPNKAASVKPWLSDSCLAESPVALKKYGRGN